MNTPLVTIGLPFYNAQTTLFDAVRSIFAQTLTDWELILVDDGSTDESAQIARRIVEGVRRDRSGNRRIGLIQGGGRRGLSSRLNQIARLAAGRYVARMDADDLIHPRRLAAQVALLQSQPQLDLVDCGVCSVDGNLQARGIRSVEPLLIDPRKILEAGQIVHAAVVAHRTWFLANPYDEQVDRAQDRELWARTCRHTRFGRVCQPLYFYREEESFSLAKYLRSAKTARSIIRRSGPALIGAPAARRLLCRSWLKAGAHVALSSLGATRWLIRARNLSLSPQQRTDLNAVIQRVLETPVPLDHGSSLATQGPEGAAMAIPQHQAAGAHVRRAA